MIEFIKEVNKLDGGWLVFLTMIMVALTFVSVVGNVIMTGLAYANQRAGWVPNFIAYLRPGQRHFSSIELVIANIGPGAATDISCCLSYANCQLREQDEMPQPKLPGCNGRLRFGALPPSEKIVIPLGMSWELMSDPAWWPMTLTLKYKNLLGRTASSLVFSLNLMDLKGLRQFGDSAENDSTKALVEIAKILKRVTNSGKTLKVDSLITTLSEKEAKETAILRRFEAEEREQ